MYIEEKKNLDTFVEDVPVGGVFRTLYGKTLMKIVPEHEISVPKPVQSISKKRR